MNLLSKQFYSLAFKHYNNPSCISIEEFELDLKKITDLVNCFYTEDVKSNIHEIANKVIVIHNLFGNFGVTAIIESLKNTEYEALFDEVLLTIKRRRHG